MSTFQEDGSAINRNPGFFCSTANGYDGSLLNNLLINPVFTDFFQGSNTGIWAGLVSSMYQIGSVAGIPFIGPVIDYFGRRGGMWIGAMFIVRRPWRLKLARLRAHD